MFRTTRPVPLRSALRALSLVLALLAGLAVASRHPSAQSAGAGLTVDQVMAMPKIDAHAHLRPMTPAERQVFAAFLEKQNFKWLTICTGGMNWQRLKAQIAEAEASHQAAPARIAWATSFDISNWAGAEWEQAARATITDGFRQGAVAVKVWKDVGMELKDKDGAYVMIDNARFDPLLEAIAAARHPLVAHLGEPRNCWLPVDQMTVQSDRNYFSKNPQYHGFLHPEVPGYEQQIAARDAVLARHPKLKVVGCHLGSLEYDVDEIARRLDKYPNLAVDLAARLVHLQIQPRDKVRAFILKYQDRLLYGTDSDFGGGEGTKPDNAERALTQLAAMYRAEATWLATDQMVPVPRAKEGFSSQGLALPAGVLRKIYFENAKKWYPGI